LVVDIPQAGPPTGPTGQVFAGGSGLSLPSGNEGFFLFASLDGSISGWNFDSATTAEVVVAPSSAGRPAIYTGLALANMNGGNFVYAANHLTGAVDVFDSNFDGRPLCNAALAGARTARYSTGTRVARSLNPANPASGLLRWERWRDPRRSVCA
jgi:hypothetical protein